MRVIVEQLVEWRLAGETEVLGENLCQYHFVHHKIPHKQTRARTPDHRGGKAQAIALMACIHEMLGLNLGWETDYPD
jgi:hypothetical protein